MVKIELKISDNKNDGTREDIKLSKVITFKSSSKSEIMTANMIHSLIHEALSNKYN